MLRLIVLALLLGPLAVQAQVYKTTDEHGNVVFTDTPPANSESSERIEIRQPNTAPPPEARPEPTEEVSDSEPVEAAPTTVAIVSPANETSIPMGPGNFDVEAEVSPELRDGEYLQLTVGGIPWGEPQRATRWELTNIFRGAQDLTVSVVDEDGETLVTSSPVRVFVHRPSINFRNRN